MISRFNALAFCCLPVWLGCSSSGDAVDTARAPSMEAVEPVPLDFELVLGEGGGFAGQWSGYTIRADGAVYRWQGPVAGSNPDSAGMLHPDTLHNLWMELQDIGFFSDSLNEKGNITAIVQVTADGRQKRASWIPGVEGLEPPQHSIEALYRRTRTLVNR